MTEHKGISQAVTTSMRGGSRVVSGSLSYPDRVARD